MEARKILTLILIVSLLFTSIDLLSVDLTDGEMVDEPTVKSPPDQPVSAYPEDNATALPLDIILKVHVSDPDGDSMNVSFYDDSSDILIGVSKNVSSNSNASMEWSGLSLNTNYSWYVNISDGTSTITSKNWSFRTASVDTVKITDGAGGSELVGGDVPMDYTEYGNCSAYNNTLGYITTVEATWSTAGGNSELLGMISFPKYNGIDVGNMSGKVWFNVTHNSIYKDSVVYNVSSITIDYINITDSPNGTALISKNVPVEREFKGYLSAYNNTEGYLFTIKGNWSAEGGSAYLIEQKTNESNVINVGSLSGEVWFNLTYDVFNYSVTYTVIPPRIDNIDITDQPNGTSRIGGSVPVGYRTWGNCSAFNNTLGYIGTKVVNWSVSGDTGTDPSIGPTPSDNSWIDVGTVDGTVTWNASIEDQKGWSNDSVLFKINAPTIDYIDITRSPGGATIEDQNVSVGVDITGYCSAYNLTSGYMNSPDATWTAEGGSSNLTGSSLANSSSIMVGDISGSVWFNASYNSFNDSVFLNVTEPTLDHIRIVNEGGTGKNEIKNYQIYVDKEISGYAAGYNDTIGYLGDIDVDWIVENDDANATTQPSYGPNSTFTSGMSKGEAEWIARHDTGLEDNVTFTILEPEIDHIQIRSQSEGKGEVMEELEYKQNDTDQFHCAGYNHTYGFIRDVEAEWVSSNPDVGSVETDIGISTYFTAKKTGDGTVYAVYGSIQNSTYFQVLGQQSPKITEKIPDLELEEDFGVYQQDLEKFAHDPQDKKSDLRWYITGTDGSVVSTAGENQTGNHVISLISQRDRFGDMRVRYWLMDSDGNTASQQGWINITPVNDAPEIGSIPDLYVHHEKEYSFDYSPYISDVDDPMNGLVLTTNDPDHTTVDGSRVIYDYPEDMVGEEVFIRLTVSDGDLSSNRVIKVSITSDYPPENVLDLPDVTLKEGEMLQNVFDLDDYIMDPDEDSLYMSYGYTHLDITIHDNHSVDMHAAGEWNGEERVTFRAQDPIGAIVEQTINVTVTPVNDPPSLKKLPAFVVHHDHPYTFDLRWYISDSDNDIDELTITTSDEEHVNVRGTVLVMEYPEEMEGLSAPYRVSLTVNVSDGVNSTFGVTSVEVGYDYPPELVVPLHDIAFNEDEKMINAFDLDNHFVDADSETIFYTSGNENITVKINENHTVDFSAPKDWNGEELITIRGADPDGALMEDTLLVSVIPVNDPPEIEDIPAQVGEMGKSWILDIDDYIYDIDDEKRDLIVTTDNPYTEVAQHKLIFTFEGSGEYTVWFNVSDGEFETSRRIDVVINESEEAEAGLGYLEWGMISVIPLVAIAGFIIWKRKRRYTIEDVFLIHKSGVLIKHKTRTLKAERDEDILAGMFTAVQNFVDDAFKEEEEGGLKRMDYGEKKVLVHKGENVILAVFFSGAEPKWALESMKNFVNDIEKRYKGKIDKWKGDLEELPGINDMMDDFVEFKGKYKESEWEE